MKPLIVILFFYSLSPVVAGQSTAGAEIRQEQILSEIAGHDIENHFLGCASCISQPRVKADSFFNNLSLKDALQYAGHESYTVRFYSFLRIMWLNDDSAFTVLEKYAADKKMVDIRGACMSYSYPFNNLIAAEYSRYIHYKYKGQSYAIDGRSYWFDKPDQTRGKQKRKKLEKLLTLYDIKAED